MKILVTGGLGFIGSHTVLELLANGHEVLIADNLSNSKIEVLDKIENISGQKPKFFQIDVTEKAPTQEIFAKEKIEGLIHFAGLKAVGESVEIPLKYYYNNLLSTINLAELCLQYGVGKFVFSSSATVYGEQPSPFREEMPLLPTTNPYGETKAMSERILTDAARVNRGFNVILLRYFNPIGAHPSGLIGEDPNGIPNNLMPYVARVASGKLPFLSIFGDDYETSDGTGVRDYIHVVDLAQGHVKAIESEKTGLNIYNLGTGQGTSVLELVNAFIAANKIDVPYKIVERRPGDIAISFADASKAKAELGWQTKLDLIDMVKSSWNFEKRQKSEVH
ncbi:MAG: UDP-glucose 4-epimerase GalE [Firmicutes bacterium]|jgi:UDP-glucose 4-epimerase|nr:UDP-glucose 4-epimerase GalE [Bacillota bacterium]